MGWFNPPNKFTTGKGVRWWTEQRSRRGKNGVGKINEVSKWERMLKKYVNCKWGLNTKKEATQRWLLWGIRRLCANALLDLIGHFLERVCVPSLVALFDSSALPLWIYNGCKRSVCLCDKDRISADIHHHKRNQINLFTGFIGKLQPISEGVKQKARVDKILQWYD